jgi:O-antigen ligase
MQAAGRQIPPQVPPGVTLTAIAAAAAPSLLAYNQPPSPTFLNQALALAAWGLFVAVGGRPFGGALRAVWPLLLALAGVAGAAAFSSGLGTLPASLGLSALGLLAAAAVMVLAGAAARAEASAGALLAAFFAAWAVAGLVNAGLAMVQVFAPALADGDWIARSGLPGRAVGNLRQPNHLSSLLLWASISVVALQAMGRLRAFVAGCVMALLVFAVVLTASRTGLVSVLLLGAWGLLDRSLPRTARRLLMAAPLCYAAAWWGMWAWAQASAHTFGGEARLAEADISSSRFGIWSDTLAMIAQQPWTGVGFGRFNLAWTLTPFPGRPTAFFDHTHNLPLQLAVELGLPLGGVVFALLCWALWLAWRRSAGDMGARCAAMIVVMIGVHSLLEYPLWYAYFLLPAAWAWGCALGSATPASTPASRPAGPRWPLVVGGAMALSAGLAVLDYQRVVRIFEAPADGTPLAQRIADGRRSLLFGHHADYAAATSGVPQPDGIRVFDRPVHYLLDTRLMMAWARALHADGQEDAAREVAARLREFGPRRAEALFGDCAHAASAAASFACQAPEHPLTWRELAPR